MQKKKNEEDFDFPHPQSRPRVENDSLSPPPPRRFYRFNPEKEQISVCVLIGETSIN